MMNKDEQTIWNQRWKVFDRALTIHEDGLRRYLEDEYSEDIKRGFDPSYLRSYTIFRAATTPYLVSVESSLEAILELVQVAIAIDSDQCVTQGKKRYVEYSDNYAREYVNAYRNQFEQVFIQPVSDSDIRLFVLIVRERCENGMSANKIADRIWKIITHQEGLLHHALTTKWDVC